MRVIYGLSVVSGLWDSKGFYIIDGGRKISSLKNIYIYLHEPQKLCHTVQSERFCALPNLPGRTGREFRPFGGAMLGSPILPLCRKQRRQMHNHLRQNMCPAHQNRSLANGPSHPRLDPEEIQMADVSGVPRPDPLLARWIATFSGCKDGPGTKHQGPGFTLLISIRKKGGELIVGAITDPPSSHISPRGSPFNLELGAHHLLLHSEREPI